MDGWTDGQLDDGQMSRWTDGQMDRWTVVEGQMDRWTNGHGIDGQMDRWTGGQVDRLTDGQMDRLTDGHLRCISLNSRRRLYDVCICMHNLYNIYTARTSAVLRMECSIDCISGSVGHHQNPFPFIS